MRVLLITHRFMPALGGVETWAHELAEGLTALGHEVVVLARTEGADGSPEAPAAARPYSTHDERRGAQRIRWVVQQHSDEQNFTQSWNNSAMRAVAAGAIRDFTPDLVHIAHNDGWGVAPFRAADEAGLPIVVTLHDYKWICARGQMIRPGGDRCTEANEELCIRCIDRQLASVPARGLLRRVLGQRGQATLAQRDGLRVVENRPDPGPAARGRWRRRQRGLMAALGGADRVTSPSQFVADRLKAAGLSRSALVVRNGSGPRSSENELSPHPSVAPRGPLRIGVFGRPHPTKGFDFLISALVALPAGAAELHFHGVVASDLTDAPPPGVILHGRYAPEEVSGRMAEVDMVAIPSLWDENHPMVACEAARARRPLLVSDLGGLPELVQQGAGGWVVPAGAAEAWAEQLALLAADPARVRRAGATMRAAKSAVEMAADFVELYGGVVARG